MRPPAFWQRPPGLVARALQPLAGLTAAATAARVKRPGLRLGVPVISVGNLTVGGTGKTPTVILLIEMLARRGIAAHVVSRGYGGRLAGPLRVEPGLTAADVGDEPLMLSAFAPVWVARDRALGGLAAVADGAGAVVLDDGHQNPGLMKDLSLVVVDAATGFGNGLCLPAGPLREPVAAGLARADLVLAVGEGPALDLPVPVLTGRLAPLTTGMPWAGLRVLAFAGIGRPEKFFATLRGLGAEVAGTVPLADHAPIPPALFSRLQAEARAAGAVLVTTEKDAARLTDAQRAAVSVLPVRLVLEDAGPLDRHLDRLAQSIRA
jgi:tetraacyldisaccharide 4'-kinase